MQNLEKNKTTIMDQPLDRACRFGQSLSFWIWTIAFVLCVPVIILFSLGYIFDRPSKTFLKTGAITLETTPEHADILINGKKLNDTTPHTLRSVIPKTYTVTLQKEGYFSHKTGIAVKPALVTEVNVALMPNRQVYEKKILPFELYKYFMVRGLIDEKILCLTDKGIYLSNDRFEVEKQITSQTLPKQTTELIKNMIYAGDVIIFWSSQKTWAVLTENKTDREDPPISFLYEAKQDIRHVFLALKNKYLLVQDGQDVKAIDIYNPAMIYLISRLNTPDSGIFYNEDSGVLYLNDGTDKTNTSMIRLKDLESNFITKLQS